MDKGKIITVDGPSGSGKTTLGRALASRLTLPFIDTGLFYRGVVVSLLRNGVDFSQPEKATEVAEHARFQVNTDPSATDHDWQLRIDDEDAGNLLRDPQYAPMLSQISAIPEVRRALLPRQRSLAEHGAVAVGRDCGTVVFPQADVKFYLLAGDAVRMQRRASQLESLGVSARAGDVATDIKYRDQVDSERAVAPLRPAADAFLLNSEELGIREMIDEALRVCGQHGVTMP